MLIANTSLTKYEIKDINKKNIVKVEDLGSYTVREFYHLNFGLKLNRDLIALMLEHRVQFKDCDPCKKDLLTYDLPKLDSDGTRRLSNLIVRTGVTSTNMLPYLHFEDIKKFMGKGFGIEMQRQFNDQLKKLGIKLAG